MKLSVKLPASFAILVLIFITFGVSSVVQLKSVYKSTNELAINWLPSIKEIGSIAREFTDFRRFELNYLTALSDDVRRQNEQHMAESLDKLKQSQARYEKLISSDEERRIYEGFAADAKQYYILHDAIMNLSKQGKKEEALTISSIEAPKLLNTALEALKKAIAINDKGGADEAVAGQATYEQSRLFAIILLSVVAVIGIFLSIYIPRSILPALIKGRDFASKLAEGDLTGSLDINNKDELGDLAASLRSVADAEKEVAAMASSLAKGDLNLEIKPRSNADVLLQSLAALLQADRRVAEATQKMANGDLRVNITPRSDSDALMQALSSLLEADRAVADLAEKLASGELRLQVQVRSENDGLMHSLRDMVAKLTDIVQEVQAGAENMASGSQQLSASSQSLSQGASEQASAVEECSSSMEEMSSAINQNADNARQTESLARKAAEDARESGSAMNQTVAAMRQIASKISIIEEIARQTDLLALNAAIEAARAGEQGRGFAVVASEVRKLAERSQAAAAEINTLSASSLNVAERAGTLLDKLVPDILKTSELVQEIAASSAEQSSGASQVNKALQQLDQVIQQNASSSEELASTAEELSSQAEQLQATMGYFQVEGGARTPKALPHMTVQARKGAGRPGKTASKGGVPVAALVELGETKHDDDFERF